MTAPRERRLRTAIIAGAAAATVFLFFLSQGKWSDPIIDSGREWIVPDALARGQLLYRDVVYWFGPFTPYFQALFLRVFGSDLGSLVVSGVVASAATLAALFLALRRVTDRRGAALTAALAVPALFFMPNAGGAILGMGYRIWHAAGFGLAAVALACGGRSGGRRRMAAAGALAGLSGLCRTEWGIVILAGALLARLRLGRRKGMALETGSAILACASVFGAALLFFITVAGADAVVRDGHVLLTGLPEETRRFLLAYSGIGNWKVGLLELLYSAGMWLAAFLGVALVSARRPGEPWPARRVIELLGLLAFLGLVALAGGVAGAVLFSAAPLVCLAALAAGWKMSPGPRSAALSAFGLAGLVLSYRRPFHIGDAAYVAPPLLFAFVCAAGLLRLAVLRQRARFPRARLSAALAGGIALLAVLAFGGRALQYASEEDLVPVPGTRGMLTARQSLARELAALAEMIRARTGERDGLVVFPEGELLNLLAQRPNPIRHKLYLPGYLTAENEPEVLAELTRSPPAAIVLWRRMTSEYGPAVFGEDYGRQIGRWIETYYTKRAGQKSRSFVLLDLSRKTFGMGMPGGVGR